MIPFAIMAINYILFFHKSEGNLSRLGKINFKKEYRAKFKDDFNKPKSYFDLVPQDLKNHKRIDILTLGDSFSAEQIIGYQNYMANVEDWKIYNLNREYYPNGNQIQMAFAMENGGLFEAMHVKYVILQVVENRFAEKGSKIDPDLKISSDYFKLSKIYVGDPKTSDLYLLKDIFRYSFYNLFYTFNKKGLISPVYKMPLDKDFFSSTEKDLLFYKNDIDHLSYNTPSQIINLNNQLNELSNRLENKGISLIVLPAPDKYDIYQDFITDNPLPKNNFFPIFNELRKSYVYINSKKIISNYIKKGEKDVYFADDTHWSPIGSKIIAQAIINRIKVIN